MFRKHLAWLCLATTLTSAQETVEPSALTLTQAARLVTEQNPRLRATAHVREAAAAQVAEAELPPQWSVGVDVEDFLGTGEFSGLDGSQFTLRLSRIFNPDDVRPSRVAVASAAGRRLDAELEAERLDLMATLAQRFVDVVHRQEVLRLASEAVTVWQRARRLALVREEAGAAPAADRLRTEIRVAHAELGRENAKHELEAARMLLASTWGGSRGEFKTAEARLCALQELPAYAVLAERISNSPELAGYATERRLREAEARLASARRRPDWTLSAGVRHLEGPGEQAFVLSAAVPLGSTSRAAPAMRRAEALGSASELDRESAGLRLRATLFDLYQELSHTVHAVEVYDEEILPRARRIRNEIEDGYRVGRFSHIALINAQAELLAAASARLDTCADHHRLLIDIERLLGGNPAALRTHPGAEK